MSESRQVAWPSYLVSLSLIVIPLSDVTTSLYPWRLLDARWRFGAVGLVSNSLLIPTVGLLIAYLTATMLNHHTLRRVIGVFSMLAAVVCVVALGLFSLDSLQTRAGVRPEMRLSFIVASIAAAIKTLIAGTAFLVIGISAIRGRAGRSGEVKQGEVPLFSSQSPIQSARPSGQLK